MDELERLETTPDSPLDPDLLGRARAYAAQGRSPRTRQAYQLAWRTFASWCEAQGLRPLPARPETVALYLTARADAGRKVATLELELAAISQAHLAVGLPSPRASAVVKEVLKGIRRALGVAPLEKAPADVAVLKAMLGALPDTLRGRRDRALLLVGFAGALRRSELVSLNVGDLAFVEDGLQLHLRRSKTDPEARGRKVGIPFGGGPATCPVRVVKAWMLEAGLERGPVFRHVTRHGEVRRRLTPHAVATIVKRAAAAAGHDPARFSGHSLRAGFATAAARAGKPERAIQAQTGHKSLAQLRRYVREGSLFLENAAAGLL